MTDVRQMRNSPRSIRKAFAWIMRLLVLGLLALTGVKYLTGMPGQSHTGPLPPLGEVEEELAANIRAHVTALAEDIGPRTVMAGRHPALLEAERYIGGKLRAFGYETRRQTFEVAGKEVANVEAVLPGRGEEGIIVVGAHYDTVSMSPGADDNASAVGVLLELARMARQLGPYAREVRFVAFTNEEPPFFMTSDMGSRRYAAECRKKREDLDAVIVLESIGYYDPRPGSQRYPAPLSALYPDTGDFIAFVGNLGSLNLTRKLAGLFRENAAFPSYGGSLPGWISGVSLSDHWAFWREGYDAVMVTDTAMFRNPHYHTPGDTAETLDYDRTARVAAGLMRVVEEVAGE